MHTPESIIATVASVTGVSPQLITGSRRSPRVIRARTLAVAMVHQIKSWWTQKQIAACFNYKTHASVIHTLHRHDWWQRSLPEYRRQLLALEFQLFTTAAR